jgi:hypothetical protein
MRAMTSLNLSSNDIGGYYRNANFIPTPEGSSLNALHIVFCLLSGYFSGPAAIGNAIRDMGAISSVNLLKNNIPIEQAKTLASILKEHPTLRSLCGNSGEEMELDMSGKQIRAEGAIMLAPEIASNGALTKFDISENTLCAGGAKALTEGLKCNQVMTEIDISNNYLVKVCKYGDADMSGITMLADAIPDMGALSSANLLRNSIPVEQAQVLLKIMRAKEKLTTLCGLSGEETELDFSGQDLGAGDTVLIANDISDMGTLSLLSLKDNGLGTKDAGEVIGDMLKMNSVLKKLDLSGNYVSKSAGGDAAGFAQGISKGIAGNGAISSLNLATNALGQAGALIICDALLGSRYVVCSSYALPARVHQCVFCFS